MIKFASINIQGDTNRERVADFLKEYKPDVVCFQELSEPQAVFFERSFSMSAVFAPMERKRPGVPDDPMPPGTTLGIGIFSKFPFLKTSAEYYYGGSGELPTFALGDETTLWRVLLSASFKKDGETYTVATTHFTRTPDGSASDKQRQDMKNLLALLAKIPELILCGDFNAPRGGEIFAVLTRKYKDNIPLEYQSSLDPKLHRLRNSKLLMVDGLFTTPQYRATDVKLTEGISDHMAVTALISRKS